MRYTSLIKGKSNRTTLLNFAVVALFLVFTFRLFHLQVIQNGKYSTLALSGQLKKFQIPAERGKIYTRGTNGEKSPLVLNESTHTVYADPQFISGADVVAKGLSPIINRNQLDLKAALENDNSSYQVIASNLTLEQANEIKSLKLKGVGIIDSTKRAYPEKTLASQLTGFVNSDGDGVYGIEQALDDEIGGQNGLLKTVTDSRGIPLYASNDNIAILPEHGKDVVLTIDKGIQSILETEVEKSVNRFKAVSGSAIVMDPKTGKIIAMGSYPTYNPEEFSKVAESNPERFNNQVVSTAYEAGSVMKTFTVATGFSEGRINSDSTYQDPRSIEIDGYTVKNSSAGGGIRSVRDIVNLSLNLGVIHILGELGGGSINEQGKKILYSSFTDDFGFGSKTGVEQEPESSGIVISPDDEEGSDIRYANMSFGQGISVTMVQVAGAFSSIVNGGTYYQPSLLYSTIEGGEEVEIPEKILRQDIVTKEDSKEIKDLLSQVTERSVLPAGYSYGGKTGTSEIARNGVYIEGSTIGSFVGFVGSDTNDADYVIMTMVEEPNVGGVSGSAVAQPLFDSISTKLINYVKLPPKE